MGSRSLDCNRQKVWDYYVKREKELRLSWFRRNETRLNEIANQRFLKGVPQEAKDEISATRKQNYRNMERAVARPPPETLPPCDLELAAKEIMRPVDPEVRKLLYSGRQNKGRENYLGVRVKLPPEKRYYCPETSNFIYGWGIWDRTKDVRDKRYGRQQVIKNSFYRKRGVQRDPDWYTEPAKLSPTVCGCI